MEKMQFSKDLYWLAAGAVLREHATMDEAVESISREFSIAADKVRSKIQKRVDELRRNPSAGPTTEQMVRSMPVQYVADGDETPGDTDLADALATDVPAPLLGSEFQPETFPDLEVDTRPLATSGTPLSNYVRLAQEPTDADHRPLTIGDVVDYAAKLWEYDAAAWNALPMLDRETFISDAIEDLRAAASKAAASVNQAGDPTA